MDSHIRIKRRSVHESVGPEPMTDTTDYSRSKDAFFALLDLDEAARERQLAQWEASDPALAATLRRQLEASRRPLPLLDSAGDSLSVPQMAQYRILRELGRGGMGRVWLAERMLGDAVQRVALKQIAHAGWNEEDRRRFERERRILAGLSHPNIAALVDGGSDAHGAPFLATAFVDGVGIDRYVQDKALPVSERVRLVARLAEAVAYAHRKLVVHRDLKPANILVGSDGEPMLLDFGIARLIGEEAITSTGPSQMTLRYAAPEQVRGDADGAGTGADVYALGVLLYELLAGASPYGATRDPAALVAAILEAVPPSPSEHARGIDADLDAIAGKALRKRPADRYAGADAFAADLHRWLAREPVEARRGERGYRLRSFVRRHAVVLTAMLALLVTSVAAVVYHLHEQDRQLAQVERQRDKAQALAEQFGRLFSQARPADTERGEISARELLERSITALKADREQPAATRAALLLASAEALNHLGQSTSALAAAQEAMALTKTLAPADPDLLADAHSHLATMLDKTGDNEGARREAAAGLALFERGLASERERQRTLEQQAAMFAENAGDRDGARAAYERIAASTRGELHLPEAMESYLSAQTNLAIGERERQPAQAERRLREALQAAGEYGFSNPDVLLAMRTYLVAALTNQRKLDEAATEMDALLAEARGFYGSQDPWLSLILSTAGNLAAQRGDSIRAEALLRESGAIAAQNYGPDHPNTRSAQADLAIVSVLAQDWPEAERRLEAILAWLDASGRGEKRLARYLRAARAYVRARRTPSTDTISAALELLRTEDWEGGLFQRNAEDWVRWLEAARARGTLSG